MEDKDILLGTGKIFREEKYVKGELESSNFSIEYLVDYGRSTGLVLESFDDTDGLAQRISKIGRETRGIYRHSTVSPFGLPMVQGNDYWTSVEPSLTNKYDEETGELVSSIIRINLSPDEQRELAKARSKLE